MSVQDCLIEWISNKSEFHTHLVSQLPCLCEANMFQLTIVNTRNTELILRECVWSGLSKMCNHIWFIFHNSPPARPDPMTFKAWKI